MSIEFTDGFDYYTSTTYGSQIWDTYSPSTNNAGRFSGSSAFLGTSRPLIKVLTSLQTRMVAFAVYHVGAIASITILEFIDGSTVHLDLRYDSSKRLQVTRNGTVLATDTAVAVLGVWYHIQMLATIDDTVGAYDVRVNGVSILSATNVDTRNAGNASSDRVAFSGSAGGMRIDDVIILNTSGSVNNALPGDCRILTTFPTGAGATTNFTPSAGSNWQNVDDNPSNDDTDYNADSTPGDIDLYTRNAVTVTGSVLAVKHSILTRKDDAGLRQVAGLCRSGSTNFVGSTQTLGSSYAYTNELYETDPNTSAAWTQTNLNNAQFGVKVIA